MIRKLWDRVRRRRKMCGYCCKRPEGANCTSDDAAALCPHLPRSGRAPDGSPLSAWQEYRFDPQEDISLLEIAHLIRSTVLNQSVYFPVAREAVNKSYTDREWAWLMHLRGRHFKRVSADTDPGEGRWTCKRHGGDFSSQEGCAKCIAASQPCPPVPLWRGGWREGD